MSEQNNALAQKPQGDAKPVAWIEGEEAARGVSLQTMLRTGHALFSTRWHWDVEPKTSNPVWPIYAAPAQAAPAEQWAPMTEEQRARWKETGLFPVEKWKEGANSTPLVCPTPTNEELRALASAVPEHLQHSGWYIGKPAFGHRYLYADNFRGMGRQWVCDFPSDKNYFGGLAEYVAAVHPRTVIRLLDRITELEAQSQAAPVELRAVAETVAEGGGFWTPCTGCYDTEDGRPTQKYAHSDVFGCELGNGCSECGGLGAVWDDTDYAEMAEFMMKDDAAPAPKLAVWYGSMPETNGKSNWTAILHAGDITEGITLDRSEYPDRVRYEADRARHLIGDLPEKPCILDYDGDKHSGYVPPKSDGASHVALTEGELRAEFERQHQGRNLKQHRLRGTYISAPIAALWNQHKRTAIWMQSRTMAAAVAESPAAPSAAKAVDVQWWLAELDQYGNAKLVDGQHSDSAGADKAMYLFNALGLAKDRRYAVARIELFEPKPSAEGVNHEAIAECNKASAALRASKGGS